MARTEEAVEAVARSAGAEARDLGENETLRLSLPAVGRVVRVVHGTVLVTREGDQEDHVLEAGDALAVPPAARGLAVAWALTAARITLQAAPVVSPGAGRTRRSRPARGAAGRCPA